MENNEIVKLGCIVCRLFFLEFSEPEIHHLREDTGLALKSDLRIPLCPYHHRLSHTDSFHLARKNFTEKYGTQLELYQNVERLLCQRAGGT